jgi:hypothetical protein
VVGGREYLFDSVGDLCLVADVPWIKRSIIVALNDVKDSYRVAAGKQSIYDVVTDETAAADDEERVALWGGHGGMVRVNAATNGPIFFHTFMQSDAIT